MENVSQIAPYERLLPWNWSAAKSRRRKQEKKRPWGKVKSHFSSLTTLADETHQALEENGSPMRLCIYKKQEEVFLDVVAVNRTKKPEKRFSRLITNEQMSRIIRNIHHRQGLVLDYSL